VPWTVEKHVHILLDDEAVLKGLHFFHINSKHDATERAACICGSRQ
jgi:hypothetical protein